MITNHALKKKIKLLTSKKLKCAQRDNDIFLIRLSNKLSELLEAVDVLYTEDKETFILELIDVLIKYYNQRNNELKIHDLEKLYNPNWFQHQREVGYVFYVDRFAKTIHGIEEHIDYLKNLGITYIHLMSLLQSREGENDGGFAIKDYNTIRHDLGTLDDLEQLCTKLRREGIVICVDIVLNHCSDDHQWAKKAQDGDPYYQDYFYMFNTKEIPNEYEKTLPEVFPDFKQGNFVFDEKSKKWVWATFHPFQWDLNWTNKNVFLEIVKSILFLANLGVDVFRLDAIAFLWKRKGTNCQNQPEVFFILKALRLIIEIVSPAVILKSEAIVPPKELIKYLGVGKMVGKVSHLAYQNVLMVHYWAALATRDTSLMKKVLSSFPQEPTGTSWLNYIRCHDDIGWAITKEDTESVGLNDHLHRAFLSDFYVGHFPNSFAKGKVFQFNPITNDSRISGTYASLTGLEKAIEEKNNFEISLSIKKILLGYALICSYGGIPLFYMGDEIAMLNDASYKNNPNLSNDNRWTHRPFMDWEKVNKIFTNHCIEKEIFDGVVKIVKLRKTIPQFHAAAKRKILIDHNKSVFSFYRSHLTDPLLCLFNFTEIGTEIDIVPFSNILDIRTCFDLIENRNLKIVNNKISLAPYQYLWLTDITTNDHD